LSATLARKMNDLPRAGRDIEEAAKRSPDDASVALEAGNIAILSGREEAARTAWEAAVKLAPESTAGKAATESLARLPK
jgi:Flp pilus assembly protein TadD